MTLLVDAEFVPERSLAQSGNHVRLLNRDVRIIEPTTLRATRDCLTVGGSAATAAKPTASAAAAG